MAVGHELLRKLAAEAQGKNYKGRKVGYPANGLPRLLFGLLLVGLGGWCAIWASGTEKFNILFWLGLFGVIVGVALVVATVVSSKITYQRSEEQPSSEGLLNRWDEIDKVKRDKEAAVSKSTNSTRQ